jgi:hypothetical protein
MTALFSSIDHYLVRCDNTAEFADVLLAPHFYVSFCPVFQGYEGLLNVNPEVLMSRFL